MLVLGIETSCDETGIGLVDSDAGIVGQALFSQAAIHQPYGGVVPELASRDHVRKLLPLMEQALDGCELEQVDAVAYTAGPGLVGALLTGAVFGHGLAWALDRPALGVHHMEAHLLVCMLGEAPLAPPYLALLVSGGHTQLIEVRGLGEYALLGETLDDAVGEAFDKVAKLLGLGYPGGPEIEKLAQRGRAGRFDFPRPMTGRPGLDFSFSGLKTHVLQTLQRGSGTSDDAMRADVALAFETAAVDTLEIKCRRALEQTGLTQLVIAGGVAANRRLRAQLTKLEKQGIRVLCPEPQFCMDNGVMVAYAGLLRLRAGQSPDRVPRVRARWPLTELHPPTQARHPAG